MNLIQIIRTMFANDNRAYSQTDYGELLADAK